MPLTNIEDMLFIVLSEALSDLSVEVDNREKSISAVCSKVATRLIQIQESALKKIKGTIAIKKLKGTIHFRVGCVTYNGKDINICSNICSNTYYNTYRSIFFRRESRCNIIIDVDAKTRREIIKLFNDLNSLFLINSKKEAIRIGLDMCQHIKSGAGAGLNLYGFRGVETTNMLDERNNIYMTKQEISEKYDYLALAAELRIKGDGTVTDEMINIIKNRLLD